MIPQDPFQRPIPVHPDLPADRQGQSYIFRKIEVRQAAVRLGQLHPAVFSASVGPKLVQERSVCREQGPIPGDCVGEGVADLLQRGPHLRSVVQPDIGDDSDVRPHHPVL